MSGFVGIDPGVAGAIAFYSPQYGGEEYLDVIDMPTFSVKRGKSLKREVDALGALDVLERFRNAMRSGSSLALIELAGCRPGQSVSAVHSNGRNWGVAYGCLASMRWPIGIVTPQAWKKALECPADKDAARKRASQLLPAFSHLWSRAKDDGRAEAALIALYAARLRRKQEIAA